jgi:glycosyltransferase involved in cell wall biosynthesis
MAVTVGRLYVLIVFTPKPRGPSGERLIAPTGLHLRAPTPLASPPVSGLRVAVDVTPLVGLRAGVTQCVEHLLAALPSAAPEIEVVPYVLSRRARKEAESLPFNTRYLRVPAGIALRAWSRSDLPRVDGDLDDVDVVHGTNFVVPPTRKPSTVTVHDTFCLVHPGECDPNVRLFEPVLRRAVRRGVWVHVSTRSIEFQMMSLFGAERVGRVPFGVPPIARTGALPPSVTSRYILAISTLDKRKRHEHLVRAFRSVAPWDPDLQLVIAGADGNAKDDVVRAVRALPEDVARRVVLVGRVDESTRAALVRKATVLAYPSADEGFGFPVLEAMAVGVPVVASRVGGIPEVAGGSALLVPVEDDPGALVDALRRVITDGGLRARLRRRGRARAEAFSWERHARGMAELWRRAAEAA